MKTPRRILPNGFPCPSALDGPFAQTLHSEEPAIDIVSFTAHILFNFGMGQHMKTFLPHRVDNRIGKRGRFNDAVGLPVAQASRRHGRIHALRAEHRDCDAVIAVGDCQKLSQLDRRCLRDRVGPGA